MPDPVRSVAPDTDLATSYPVSEELTCSAPEAVPNQSVASEPPAACASTSGASGLVSKFSQKDYSAVIANASAAPTPPTESRSFFVNTDVRGPQGFTVGSVVAKATDGNSSSEAFSISLQGGAQNTAQAGVLHFAEHETLFGMNLSANADVLNLKGNLGTLNDDGSAGANIGAMATAGGVEVTAEHSGWSGTLGWSASVGVAVSSGTRDIDNDGKTEHCFKAAIGPATVGICTEF